MFRSLLFTFFLFLASVGTCLHADAIDDKLKLIYLDNDDDQAQNQQTERQFVHLAIIDLVNSLQADKVDRKSATQKIELIHERVTMNFLRTYRSGANLIDLFRLGEYDDVSMVLLEAILLEQFGVAYVAFIDHWEARLLADPAGAKTVLAIPVTNHQETARQRAFRMDYVEVLNLTVLPAQRPTSSVGVDSLFNRYHYAAREALNFKQLVGYWHYQQALRLYGVKDYLGVIRTLNVARQTGGKRPAFEALEQATYLQLAEWEGENAQQSLFYFFELWHKDPDNAYLPNALLTHFIYSTNHLLKPGTSFGEAEQLYQFLDSRGKDHPAWRNHLREIYYLQKSRYYGEQNRYDLVTTYIDSLYVMRPGNPVYQKVIGDLTFRAIRAEGLSGQALQQRLDLATARYPFMLKNRGIANVVLEDEARTIRAYYESDQGYQGDNQLVLFRNQLTKVSPTKQRNIWVLTVYVAASNYYFRLGNYAQALRLVEEGLAFNPEDDYLLHRRDVLRRY